MASLYRAGKAYGIRFLFNGQRFKRTLRTRDDRDAACAKAIVELTLYRLRTGQLSLVPGVDIGDFIVSGGTLAPPQRLPETPPEPPAAFRVVVADYLQHIQHQAAPSYAASQKTHLRHFTRYLKATAEQPVSSVTEHQLQGFIDAQLAKYDPNTVNKQRITLVQFYKYVVRKRKLLPQSPMAGIEKIKFGCDRPPFRTKGEIESILKRGGLSEDKQLELWECLFLSPADIAGLLKLVRAKAEFDTSLLLHAIPAYTGMRRGEVIGLQWVDLDLRSGTLTARSRKQSRTRRVVSRQIEIHPELREILQQHREQHPLGQFVVCHETTRAQLTADHANRRFWQPLRHTQWCLDAARHWYKIGFHTYRHSFASNLAAAGVDQRVIDEFMGHTTEEMRKRYRHLFPSKRFEAIRAISYASSGDLDNSHGEAE